jgi:hypothetical protein
MPFFISPALKARDPEKGPNMPIFIVVSSAAWLCGETAVHIRLKANNRTKIELELLFFMCSLLLGRPSVKAQL